MERTKCSVQNRSDIRSYWPSVEWIQEKWWSSLILIVLLAGCASPWSSPPPSPHTAARATPSPTTSSRHTGFKGIIQFQGQQDPNNASNPYLAGADLVYYWSQLEPQKGQYHWDIIDQDMKPWVDNGKKVVFRISTSGWTAWNRPYSQQGTPQWVYDLGVPSVTEIDGSVFPQYWNPIFLNNLQDFIHAFATRYDRNPSVAFVQVAIGVGGETKVDSHNNNLQLLQLWQSIGYSDPVWWDTVQKIITIYTANFHTTPLVIMPDKTFIGGMSGYKEALLLDYAVKHGLWLQDNGLYADRTLPPIWSDAPYIAEQRQLTSKSGDTLLSDLQTALKLGATYTLVFTKDIDNPANQPALQWAASQAHQ